MSETIKTTGHSYAEVRLQVKTYLHEHPNSSTKVIAEETGIHRLKVMGAIAVLVSQQRVNHVGETTIAQNGRAIPIYSLAD